MGISQPPARSHWRFFEDSRLLKSCFTSNRPWLPKNQNWQVTLLAAASDTFAQRNTTLVHKATLEYGRPLTSLELIDIFRKQGKPGPQQTPWKWIWDVVLGAVDAPIFMDFRRQTRLFFVRRLFYWFCDSGGGHSNLWIWRIYFEPKDPKIQFDSKIFTASLHLVVHREFHQMSLNLRDEN